MFFFKGVRGGLKNWGMKLTEVRNVSGRICVVFSLICIKSLGILLAPLGQTNDDVIFRCEEIYIYEQTLVLLLHI